MLEVTTYYGILAFCTIKPSSSLYNVSNYQNTLQCNIKKGGFQNTTIRGKEFLLLISVKPGYDPIVNILKFQKAVKYVE